MKIVRKSNLVGWKKAWWLVPLATLGGIVYGEVALLLWMFSLLPTGYEWMVLIKIVIAFVVITQTFAVAVLVVALATIVAAWLSR